MREVVSWGELPGVFQVESNCTGITFRCWYKATKCTLCELHWTVVDLETSNGKCPTVKWGKQHSIINEKTMHSGEYRIKKMEHNCNRQAQV